MDSEAEFHLNYLDLPLIASIRGVHSKLEIITSSIAELKGLSAGFKKVV